jgi:predicted MFS family arabinose efflux permease
MAVPDVLRNLHGMDSSRHWLVYLGVFASSIVLTVPLVVWSERNRRPGRAAFVGGMGLAVALVVLVWAQTHFDALLAALVLYFGAFNFLEARLPAALTVAAGEASRGAALGVFATCQFAGAFAGGLMGGLLLGSHWHVTGILVFAVAAVVAWLPLAAASESRQFGAIDGGRTAGGRLQ